MHELEWRSTAGSFLEPIEQEGKNICLLLKPTTTAFFFSSNLHLPAVEDRTITVGSTLQQAGFS